MPETNVTLYVNYNQIKKFKKQNKTEAWRSVGDKKIM